MGKSRAFIVLAATVAIAAAPITSCLDATEIVIGLTANVDCATVTKNGVLIRIGSATNIDTSPPNAFTSYACTSDDATTMNNLGNVTIVPSGSIDSVVAIDIVLGVDPAQPQGTASCLPEAPGKPCIYARRQISFLPHTHVYLPIELDASCAGNLCDPGVTTCKAGVCVPIDIDSHDCGTQCTTGPDAVPPTDSGPYKDSPIIDAPVFDVPIIVDAGCLGTICNGLCVDLTSDKQNCGKCGLDCSNGVCSNGTCQLSASASGSCLALYNNLVWVQTSNSVEFLKTNGGIPAAAAQSTIYTIASVPSSNLAWFEKTTNNTDLNEHATTTLYTESGSAEFLAISPNVGYAWSDPSLGALWHQPKTGSPTNILQVPKQSVPIAMADKNVYASVTGQVVWMPINGQPTYISASAPTSIVVDDPTNQAANVYFVDKGTTVVSTDYQLANKQTFATGTLNISALAWDASASTVVANMGSEIDIAQSGSFVTVVKTTKTAPKCVAVDKDAVYWLEQAGGLYKHAKP